MHISLGVQRLTVVHRRRKCPDALTQDQAESAILSDRVELKGTALGKHVSNPDTEGTHTREPAGCASVAAQRVTRGSKDASLRELLTGDGITVLSSPALFWRQGLILPRLALCQLWIIT